MERFLSLKSVHKILALQNPHFRGFLFEYTFAHVFGTAEVFWKPQDISYRGVRAIESALTSE